jgi:hypothetical protein
LAGKELGYKYEIWVYDRKGNKIENMKKILLIY